MKNCAKGHGTFSWNELLTTDLDSAKEFYGQLFGWSYTETKTIYGNRYLVAMKDDRVVAGMMLKDGNVPDDVPSCWDPYVTVDDVDVSTERVRDLGGTIVLPPTDIPNVGRFCVVTDVQGVSLNLIAYAKSDKG